MIQIPCFINEELLKKGIKEYIKWDPDKVPHIAVGGASGTGKTTAVKYFMYCASSFIPDLELTICDFKGDSSDFGFLIGEDRFYRFEECKAGFDTFYENFIRTQKRSEITCRRILLFEEWASFINYYEKKDAEELKKKLASLLMLGRSYKHHIFLSQQRLDASYFEKGRDNFSIMTLGNPSRECIEMVYSQYKKQIIPDRKRGTGYILLNGSDFKKIVVPTIKNMDKVNKAILKAVRNGTENAAATAESDAEQKLRGGQADQDRLCLS